MSCSFMISDWIIHFLCKINRCMAEAATINVLMIVTEICLVFICECMLPIYEIATNAKEYK